MGGRGGADPSGAPRRRRRGPPGRLDRLGRPIWLRRSPRISLAPPTPGRLARYQERLASAADALDRGRYEDARRMVQPVLRDVPELAFAHELAGLASYRLGQWRKAATQLEAARLLDGTLNHHAVLADCYRALRRYTEVDQLWRELREGSPSPALLAEGRIVAAGAQADRGDLNGALRTMAKAGVAPKKVREHHLRQWYVLGDLSDRSGDVIAARRWFGLVAQHDARLRRRPVPVAFVGSLSRWSQTTSATGAGSLRSSASCWSGCAGRSRPHRRPVSTRVRTTSE